jgi:hypothetical protein
MFLAKTQEVAIFFIGIDLFLAWGAMLALTCWKQYALPVGIATTDR